MKINFPVEVLNGDCINCSELDILQDKHTLWGNSECIHQDIELKCSHINLCKRLSRRFTENEPNIFEQYDNYIKNEKENK